jgi:hypothetical protein
MIINIQSTWRNARIHHERSDKQLSAALESGCILIFKEVFPAEEILVLRQQLLEWSQHTTTFSKTKSASVSGLNYHRRDDAEGIDSPTHMFHQWGFGEWNTLPDFARGFLFDMAESVLELQNRLAGSDYKLCDSDLRIKAYRFPRGGGFQKEHEHSYLPYKALLFTMFSRVGVDCLSGFELQNQDGIMCSTQADIGDVVAFRPDTPHAFPPCDPEMTLDWNSNDGLWFSSVEPIDFPRLHGNNTCS